MQFGKVLWLLPPVLGALLVSAPLIAEPSSGLVPPDGFIFGGVGHPGSDVYSQTRGVTITEQMELLNDVGLGWYRFDVFAREPADELDVIVPAAEEAGIELYPMLYPPVELRKKCPPDDPKPCQPEYENVLTRTNPFTDNLWTLEEIEAESFRYAKAAATKWKGRIKVWDLLNEPDGWTLKDDHDRHGNVKDDYCDQRIAIAKAILRGQANGIKAGDPQAKVSLNTGGWLHTGFVDHMIDRRDENDEPVPFDILSWHWYDVMGRMDRVATVGNFDLLENLRSYGKPIWIGEANSRNYQDSPNPDAEDCSRNPADSQNPVGEAWALEFMRAMHGYRARGVEAYFHYEILDETADGYEGNFGLVEIDTTQINGEVHYNRGTKKPIYCKTKKLIAGAKDIKSDGSFFTDFFDGSVLDPTKWSISTTGAWGLRLSGGQLHWDSSATAEGYVYTNQAFTYSGAAEWALEIRFKVNPNSHLLSLGPPTGNPSTSPRQVQLIAGSTNPANPGITRDFSLSLLEHPNNAGSFSLGWSNWLGLTDASFADPDGFATDLARGVFYTVVMHHRADGEIDIYIDGIHLARRTSFAGTALSLVMADLSSGIGADVDVDYIRFGLPLIRDSVASP